jgi:ribosomal protein S18 acetylase RimI-like enzyme
LDEAPLPARFFTKLEDGQEPLFAAHRLSEPSQLFAMGLDGLVPAPVPEGMEFHFCTDAEALLPLYRHYPGNYFTPAAVSNGLYAIATEAGEIVAAAGTHAYAPQQGAAALGNVVTATSHRGRGIAGALVAFLCEDFAQRGCRHIGLHVERQNAAAIACYRKVGFRIHSALTQWTAGAA